MLDSQLTLALKKSPVLLTLYGKNLLGAIVARAGQARPGIPLMTRRFKVGDHVTWNSEAGHVSGEIVKVHTRDLTYKGYTHHASEGDPQYEIQSDRTDHIALHKGSALRKKR